MEENRHPIALKRFVCDAEVRRFPFSLRKPFFPKRVIHSAEDLEISFWSIVDQLSKVNRFEKIK